MDLVEWHRSRITDINIKLVIIFYSACNNIGIKVKYCAMELFALRSVSCKIFSCRKLIVGLIEEAGKQAITKIQAGIYL